MCKKCIKNILVKLDSQIRSELLLLIPTFHTYKFTLNKLKKIWQQFYQRFGRK